MIEERSWMRLNLSSRAPGETDLQARCCLLTLLLPDISVDQLRILLDVASYQTAIAFPIRTLKDSRL